LSAGKKISARAANKMAEEGVESLLVKASEELMGKFAAEDLVNAETGEIFAEAGDELTEEVIAA
jgi:DNA-directed RNA polymerase subunit beta